MEKTVINGTPLTAGIAVGTVCCLNRDYDEKLKSYKQGKKSVEARKLDAALKSAREGLQKYLKSATLTKDAYEILNMHLMLLDDEGLINAVKNAIGEGLSAPGAVIAAIGKYKAKFATFDDEYIRERANDIEDVGNRVVRALLGVSEVKIEGDDVILVAEDIDPAFMAGLSQTNVKAVVLKNASHTAHSVIIAKSKGFLVMSDVRIPAGTDINGKRAIVDCNEGRLIVSPDSKQSKKYDEAIEELDKKKADLLKKAADSAVTKDGRTLKVLANINEPSEVADAFMYGCEGVGLYRTEFHFMGADELPDEETQFKAYKKLIKNAKGAPCIVRTLDIGGDKSLACLNLEKEDNPYLGFRGVRISLDRKDVFKTQLRALLRAGAEGQLGIMVPMIDTLAEIKEAKACFEEAKKELKKAKIPYGKDVRFGIMVETPACALMAESFANYVDFFSIGTNDLVQYTMAADRSNRRVDYLCDYFDPAVLKLIAMTIEAAKGANTYVSICGEMAKDPLAIPFLLAAGIESISLASYSAPEIKEVIRNTKVSGFDLKAVLSMESAAQVRAYLGKYE